MKPNRGRTNEGVIRWAAVRVAVDLLRQKRDGRLWSVGLKPDADIIASARRDCRRSREADRRAAR